MMNVSHPIEKRPWKTLIFSFLLLVLSLTQNAFAYHDFDGDHQFHATEAAFMGAIAILGGGVLEWIIWLANPLALLTVVFISLNNRHAKKLNNIALILAFSFFFWNSVLISEDGREVTIIRHGLGYWLWLASLMVLRIAAGLTSKIKPKKKVEVEMNTQAH